MEQMEQTAARILALMDEQGITRKRLAAELQVSYSSVINYLNARRWMSLNLLREVCLLLGTSTDYLLGISDIKYPYRLPEDEQNLLQEYRMLPDAGKHFLHQQQRQLHQLCQHLPEN
jgi:transcriptional regulator with XRE-family HTH domain